MLIRCAARNGWIPVLFVEPGQRCRFRPKATATVAKRNLKPVVLRVPCAASPFAGLVGLFLFAIHCLGSAPIRAQTTSKEVLKAAIRNVEGAAWHTIEVQFSAELLKPAPVNEQITRRVNADKEALKRLLERTPKDLPIWKVHKKNLDNCEEIVTSQMLAQQKQDFIGTFRSIGPYFGGDRFMETRIVSRINNASSSRYAILTRHLDRTLLQSIFLMKNEKTCLIGESPFSVGISPPSDLGRFPSPIANRLHEQIDSLNYKEVPESRADASERHFLIEEAEDRKLQIYAVIVPEYGHCLRLLEIRTNEGDVVLRRESDNFFQVGKSDVWFPSTSSETSYDRSGGEMVKLIRWKVKPTGIDLDKQFVGDVVDLVIPAGTTVQYRVQDVGLQFRTTCNIPVSIDDLVNLPKHDCVKISRSLPIADNQPIVRSGRLLISMAILILGIPACMLAVRWFRKSVVVSSLVVLSSAIFGCDKVEDVDHGRSIVVQPSGFDFRSISSEQTFLSDELIVSNMGVDPKRFNLSASCGCTVLEVDEFLVDPGETVRVPFTLQIQGRKGLFTSIIRLIEFRGKTFEVPVRAFFTQDIFANPSRVLLSDSGEQSLTGSVLIVDSTRPETDIEVRGSNPAIQVTIVRGEDGAGEYLVSVPFHSLEGTDNAIQVYYSGQVNPVMTIPIIGDPSLLLKKNQN